jgi:hypothetical protein
MCCTERNAAPCPALAYWPAGRIEHTGAVFTASRLLRQGEPHTEEGPPARYLAESLIQRVADRHWHVGLELKNESLSRV